MKATILLILTNLCVVFVIGVLLKIFGIDSLLAQQHINYIGILIFSCIYGFAGAFISLLLSKSICKRSMGVHVIERPQNRDEAWLLETVQRLAEKARIDMPEVGIFDNHAPNAFATGANKNAALVAVSTGLLRVMPANEVEAVLGHEITHVSNGDMITSTLIQGVINSFVFFFAQIVAMLLTRNNDEENNGSGMAYFLVSQVLLTIFGLLGSLVVYWHSRQREYKADAGGAALSRRQDMIDALATLQRVQNQGISGALPKDMQAFGIVALAGLFATHPPLERRIAALQNAA